MSINDTTIANNRNIPANIPLLKYVRVLAAHDAYTKYQNYILQGKGKLRLQNLTELCGISSGLLL